MPDDADEFGALDANIDVLDSDEWTRWCRELLGEAGELEWNDEAHRSASCRADLKVGTTTAVVLTFPPSRSFGAVTPKFAVLSRTTADKSALGFADCKWSVRLSTT